MPTYHYKLTEIEYGRMDRQTDRRTDDCDHEPIGPWFNTWLNSTLRIREKLTLERAAQLRVRKTTQLLFKINFLRLSIEREKV